MKKSRFRIVAACAALLLSTAACGAEPIHPAQGWGDAERDAWYWTTQGSRLMPLAWMLALEREDRDDVTFVDDRLARFGYLPVEDPSRLPIGFAIDQDVATKQDWVGLNCAACHTSRISYLGKVWQIDGAAADADFYGFIKGLSLALARTTGDPARFDRFVKKVGTSADDADGQTLRDEVARFSTDFSRYVARSTPDHPWGPARLDAFGMIFNQVTAVDLRLEKNSRPPNAPVSYPFLWDVARHDRTQWNGSAKPIPGAGWIFRDVGQVLGVFGKIDLTDDASAQPYPSSASFEKLALLGRLGTRLQAPSWPDEFGPYDRAGAARGKAIYANVGCDGCHKVAESGAAPGVVVMTPLKLIRTEPATLVATNPSTPDLRDTGVLLGRVEVPKECARFARAAPPGAIVAHAAAFAVPLPKPTEPCGRGSAPDPLAYKARPLNGIWATAPFLHNGSVPNLDELLMPEGKRSRLFGVGSREFDPVKVGFESDPRQGTFLFDTALPGNSNRGHSGKRYGTELNARDRADLIEYLKSL